jgi:anaerobic magnesium-protoporphyrin IX monomethyl ester cyclase
MRVFLVEPYKVPWEMMGDVIAPPLGLAQLAACLEGAHIPVEILDANALGIGAERLGAAIAQADADLIGMTVCTPYVPEIGHAVRIARQAAPQATIVLGGPHVTFTAEETLRAIPEADVVVRGEGDQILVDLVRALEAGDGLERVPGVNFRRNGQVVETPFPPPLDVTKLPMPALHLLPMERYRFPALGGPFATVQASRGCPFKCTFCSEWPFWRGGWRPFEPEMIVEQLDLLVNRYGRRNIWFGDDCFNVGRDHVAAICEGILRRGIDVRWYFQGRADLLVRHQDLLALMHRAGNRMVQIGIEASSDEQRDELNKQLSTETVKQAVRLLRQHDIVCQGMIIVGMPSDSPRTFQHKVGFVKWLGVDHPIFTLYTPFPGTPAFDEAVAQGWLEFPADYARYDMTHALIPTRHMTRRQVWIYTGWAFASFYFHPLKLVRGLFSRNKWRRLVWRRMVSYIGKQLARSLVPRFLPSRAELIGKATAVSDSPETQSSKIG